MKKLLSKIALVTAATVALASPAHAAFETPATQDFANMLGDNTAGAESGVFELLPMILSAGLAIVTLTVIMVGIVFTRKVVRKFTG